MHAAPFVDFSNSNILDSNSLNSNDLLLLLRLLRLLFLSAGG